MDQHLEPQDERERLHGAAVPSADAQSDSDQAYGADEEAAFSPEFLESLVLDLKNKDKEAVRLRVAELHVADLADLLSLLSGKQRKRLIKYLGDTIDPELFHEVDGVAQDDLYEVASTDQIADAVSELDTDDAVYVLEELDEDDRTEVLDALSQPERRALETLLDYPEDTAGRIMQRETVAIPEFWTVGQTIDHLRARPESLPEAFYDLFVIDPAYKLAGIVSLSTLMRNPRDVKVTELMNEDPRVVYVLDDQEDVAYRFNKYHLISAPVLDEQDRLVGVLTADDMLEVIEEEAEEDILALAGVSEASVNEDYRETLIGRFVWLAVNLVTAIMASVVIGLFDATLEEMVALAILMPIIASMGGNAGTQTMTVAVRAIATKELDKRNMWRVMWREGSMAAINGVVLAALSGALVWIWFGSFQLSAVFAIGMIVNLVVAGLSGLAIPLILRRLGADPAIASSVFVTTITDVVGFFAFLGLAAIMLL